MSIMNTLSRMFGLSGEEHEEDERELEDDEADDVPEEEEEDDGERFSLSSLFSGGRKGKRAARQTTRDEEENDTGDGRDADSAARSGRRSNVIHDERMKSRAAQEPQYTHCERIVTVRQIEQCREIIKYLLHGESIMLNLENIDPKDCGRVVDLLSGAAFALQGRMIKVAHLSYLLAPENVYVVDEDIYAGRDARYR